MGKREVDWSTTRSIAFCCAANAFRVICGARARVCVCVCRGPFTRIPRVHDDSIGKLPMYVLRRTKKYKYARAHIETTCVAACTRRGHRSSATQRHYKWDDKMRSSSRRVRSNAKIKIVTIGYSYDWISFRKNRLHAEKNASVVSRIYNRWFPRSRGDSEILIWQWLRFVKRMMLQCILVVHRMLNKDQMNCHARRKISFYC